MGDKKDINLEQAALNRLEMRRFDKLSAQFHEVCHKVLVAEKPYKGQKLPKGPNSN